MIKNNLSKEEIKELREINDSFDKSIYGKQSFFFIKSVGWFAIGAFIMAAIYFIESLFGENTSVFTAICLLGVFICVIAMIVMVHMSTLMAMIYNNNRKK